VADFRIKDTREFRDWVNKTLVQNTERLNGINEKIELHHTQTMQRLDSIDNLLNIQNGRIRASEKIGNINRGAGMFISALFAVLLIVIALMK
jgi:tetrahydromethanopterin S-methyltransferase subunit G